MLEKTESISKSQFWTIEPAIGRGKSKSCVCNSAPTAATEDLSRDVPPRSPRQVRVCLNLCRTYYLLVSTPRPVSVPQWTALLSQSSKHGVNGVIHMGQVSSPTDIRNWCGRSSAHLIYIPAYLSLMHMEPKLFFVAGYINWPPKNNKSPWLCSTSTTTHCSPTDHLFHLARTLLSFVVFRRNSLYVVFRSHAHDQGFVWSFPPVRIRKRRRLCIFRTSQRHIASSYI
jgi:hypothetical protein